YLRPLGLSETVAAVASTMRTLLVAQSIRSVVPMDALTQLAQEHADFIEKLTELEAVLDEMMATREASDEDIELLDESVRFFEEEMFPHFEREEKFLLPPLEAKVGLYGSLVNVVAYEHAEVRREVTKIKEGLAALKAKRRGPHVPEVEEVNRHGVFARSVTRIAICAPNSFAMETSFVLSTPRSLRWAARRVSRRAASISVADSAIISRINWKSPIGRLNAFRSYAYFTAASRAARAT